MKFLKSILSFLLIYPYTVSAGSLGDVAHNAQEPISLASTFLEASCIVIGFGFIAFAYANYRRYKINPYEIRLSSIFVELILGLVLVLLGSLRKLNSVF